MKTSVDKIWSISGYYNDCCSQSATTINELINTNLELRYMTHSNWGIFEKDTVVKQSVELYLENKIINLHKQCLLSIEEMCSWVADMETEYKRLGQLESQASKDDTRNDLLPKIVVQMLDVVEMYSKDLLLKRTILVDAVQPKQTDHRILSMYIASWSMSPHIDKPKIKYIRQICDEINV
eukprot:TRINITY_DN8419_c0_g1_i1.p1 TRINITY_DN8419_c0_g1~~TRINITY_DN8419_c0_g1_i1.p1  ORF type:complete len:180 (-),score=6.01 TRINITY_DN8419_c0_g1_i1:9-548(-)